MKASEARQLTEQKGNELNTLFNEIRKRAINKYSGLSLNYGISDAHKVLLQYLGYNVDVTITYNSEEKEQFKTVITW